MSVDEDEDLPVAGTAVILRDAPRGVEVLLLRRPDRGSFAGAWVFPGGMVDPGDRVTGAPEQEDAGRAAVRETAEEVGLELERLVPLSCWVPPAGIPKRVRTWFFLAPDPGDAIRPAPDEVVETRWFGPESALAARDAGEIALMPPTWRTLHALCSATDVEDALARVADPGVFRTRMQRTAAGILFFWDGDELAGAPVGSRERLIAEDPVWRLEGR
ncbi:Diadenosine hexaphosphate hydrolase [Microbacterium azadirachtae]|uniref:Diadenosine hexaphosphate hydrolase n=1 Tax=Microbacterium azadirachtae TaxID=582680 RepID=A0A0F0L6S0_9MICO|nr:NUDIX domain-containing protein [Microbacterium azadirachtae]KJL27221.1 Diadenosine hexaphosphate hydrolase [Microbacterium azadirachtae]